MIPQQAVQKEVQISVCALENILMPCNFALKTIHNAFYSPDSTTY